MFIQREYCPTFLRDFEISGIAGRTEKKRVPIKHQILAGHLETKAKCENYKFGRIGNLSSTGQAGNKLNKISRSFVQYTPRIKIPAPVKINAKPISSNNVEIAAQAYNDAAAIKERRSIISAKIAIGINPATIQIAFVPDVSFQVE